jgi:hypothetical protein
VLVLSIIFIKARLQEQIEAKNYNANSAIGIDHRDKFCFTEMENCTSSDMTLDSAYKWYRSCCNDHIDCRQLSSREPFTPTRLLDIGVKGDTIWKLRIPRKEEMPHSLPYMTLSYRWGLNPNFRLLSSNIEEYRLGKLICDLPKTFRESIIVARRFSIRYLWIDSLCIIQNSVRDWNQESAQMYNVYAHSSCNIAASASAGPEGGLFRAREPRDVRPGLVEVGATKSGRKTFYLTDTNYMARHISGPLDRRGWVFQERLLAPRVLHFTEHQIIWECFTENKCEAFPKGIPFHQPLKRFDSIFGISNFQQQQQQQQQQQKQLLITDSAFQKWKTLVNQYTKCIFTYPDDKLNAFSGMVTLYQGETEDKCLAGLWKSRLSEGLNWYATCPVRKSCTPFRAPSWSWASLDGPVMAHGLSIGSSPYITILEVGVVPSGEDSTAQVVRWYIRLNGYLTQVNVECDDTNKSWCGLKVGKSVITGTPYPDTLDLDVTTGKRFFCLTFGTFLCTKETVESDESENEGETETESLNLELLILEAVADCASTYRRIGLFVVEEQDHIAHFGLRLDTQLRPRTAIRDEGMVVSAVRNFDVQTSNITLV